MRTPIPLSQRRGDVLFIVFFLVNLFFITYIVDIEQLTVADVSNFQYPIWPPRVFVDMVHWWGRSFDPVLLARPPWWRATIWIDSLLFGPFYAFAIYAFIKGRDWIRIPSVMWASVMMTVVTVILFEEMIGPFATPARGMVLFANAAWFLYPIAMLFRLGNKEHPFTTASP